MKKVLISLSFIVISSVIFLGCSNSKDIDNNKQKTNSEQTVNKNDTDKENKVSESEVDEPCNNNESCNNTHIKKHKNENKSDKKNSNDNSSNINKKDTSFFNKIKTSSEKGMVINSNFKIGQSIDTVISKLGKPNSENFIPDAKGTYFTFNSYNLAFACNKGSQIFEIRSFDKSLKNLNSKEIKKFFGKPNYAKTLKETEIVYGYKINSEFKILFVFDSNGSLKHYSVLNPSLTKNSMANDPGRTW